jgi:glycosyltransferase involved in cell wall biosynthesis
VLAGDRPPTNEDLQLARRLGIGDAIELRLALEQEELAKLYRSAAVFALSSNEEGLGIVALEAMASGVPAVCTRCGGPETSVIEGATGFLVDIGDSEAFADRLTRVLTNRVLRDQMGQASRQHMEANFSLARTGARFLDAYDELLAEPRSRKLMRDIESAPAR